MNKYTKEIMDLLKSTFKSVVGNRRFQTASEARSYYLEKLNDNLYKPMDEFSLSAYGQGSGNEIASGKMNALRSSSALTYNLFWNHVCKIKNPESKPAKIENGTYSVEFEKQYHTLKRSVPGKPANLDAFLYCEDTCEAIACEMKMMEWIFNKPGNLKNKYLFVENYINNEAGKVFVAAAKELILQNDYEDTNAIKDEYPCIMSRYDAFQMFKHAVACYSACVSEDTRTIKKLTLVNCAWTLPVPEKLSENHRDRYIREEKCELAEFEEFRRIMSPVKSLFADINVDFEICFYTFKDFLALFEKTTDELNYLRRYTFDNKLY